VVGTSSALQNVLALAAKVAPTDSTVLIAGETGTENFSVFKPGPTKEQSVNDMLDQLIAWGGALKTLRKISA
jgi:hypothetical protein